MKNPINTRSLWKHLIIQPIVEQDDTTLVHIYPFLSLQLDETTIPTTQPSAA